MVILCCQSLDVIRNIIKRNAEKGLLPNYTLDIMHMKSQYNTIGIIGIYEALQKYGFTYKDEFGYTYYMDEGINFATEILNVIKETKTEFAKDKDYMINIEQIPGEASCCCINGKKINSFVLMKNTNFHFMVINGYPLVLKLLLKKKFV